MTELDSAASHPPTADSSGGADTTLAELDAICRAAAEAAPGLDRLGRAGRSELLDHVAHALEQHRDEIVQVADRETALGSARLNGELTRTCYQLRLFATVLRDGAYLEAAIDHSGDTGIGPAPDIRRMLVPLGPVAIFGASNFPLAFSVPGGDTASALAVGCPVVIKAHGSHAETGRICYEIMRDAISRAGAPAGTMQLVFGLEAGAALVAHPAIQAVGFTGSLVGGRALLEIINRRPVPIPFYGELSSLNPVVVTPRAAVERADEIGRELAASFMLGAGQFCTKPGIVFVPASADGRRLEHVMADAVAASGPQQLLNAGIERSYADRTTHLRKDPHIEVLREGGAAPARAGATSNPLLLGANAAQLPAAATEEHFGPTSMIARYDGDDELLRVLRTLPGSLTTTIHTGADEIDLPSRVVDVTRALTGRFVFNGYPTGVAVSWAQHHGGPWPATNSVHTSVGTTAVRRFLRPVAWQSAPQELLPAELRDGDSGIARRIDGVLITP